MAFFDKVSSLAKSAAEKTGEVVEVQKLNMKINECKGRVATSKTQLGEYYWKKFEGGAVLDDEAMEICASIKAENETIEQYNSDIQKLKGIESETKQTAGSFCTSCGASIQSGKNFCPNCGTKVNE